MIWSPRRADWPVFRAAGKFHQQRIMGTRNAKPVGGGFPQWRPAAAPSKPALRGGAGRAFIVCRTGLFDMAAGHIGPSRPCHWRVLTGYGASRALIEQVREPDAHLGYIFSGITMGQIFPYR